MRAARADIDLEAGDRAEAAERLFIHREAELGHAETPAMRAAMLAFFAEAFARS